MVASFGVFIFDYYDFVILVNLENKRFFVTFSVRINNKVMQSQIQPGARSVSITPTVIPASSGLALRPSDLGSNVRNLPATNLK